MDLELVNKLEVELKKYSCKYIELMPLLKKLTPVDISENTEIACKLTPLLLMIGGYAMIELNMDDDVVKDLYGMVDNNDNNIVYDALELAKLCSDIITSMCENNLLHPAILYHIYKTNLFDTEEEFIADLTDIVKITSDENKKDTLLYYLQLFDEATLDVYEKLYNKTVLPLIKKAVKTNNVRMLLDTLCLYFDSKINLEGGLDKKVVLISTYIAQVVHNMPNDYDNGIESYYDEKVGYEEMDIYQLVEHFEYNYLTHQSEMYEYKENFNKILMYQAKK